MRYAPDQLHFYHPYTNTKRRRAARAALIDNATGQLIVDEVQKELRRRNRNETIARLLGMNTTTKPRGK